MGIDIFVFAFSTRQKNISLLYCVHSLCYEKHRGIEQLAARRAHNPKVPGSSPGPATWLRLSGYAKQALTEFFVIDC